MNLPNAAVLPEDVRERAAWGAKTAHDITPWPELAYFNTLPCPRHAPELNPACSKCGIKLRRHQRVGATWLYLAGKGLLSDVVGSGKTAQVLAVFAMCKMHNELGLHNRAVVICKAAAVEQWGEQVRRLLPGVQVLVASGTPQQRVAGYMGGWEVAIVSDRTFAPARGKKDRKYDRDGDVEIIRQFPVGILVYDDIDSMRNERTRAAYAINKLAEDCRRAIGVHGTPLQKRLPELWSFLQPVGGRAKLGTLARVKARYVAKDTKAFYQRAMVCEDGHLTPPPSRRCQHEVEPAVLCGKSCHPDPTFRKVLRKVQRDGGINQDTVGEFRSKIAPLVLRRTTADLDDVDLPAIQPNPVHIELTPEQSRRYAELRRGVLRRLKDGQEEISQMEAQQVFIRGWQICAGTAALDGPDHDVSAKYDWVMDKLTGDLDGEKAVVFSYFRDNVEALHRRLAKENIGHVVFWSAETNQKVREERRQRFLHDPECRVLLGTTTIEQSLNLQAARHLIAVDTIINPARMTQLIGRVRRQGSEFGMVFFHHLLAKGTQEDGYLSILRGEQGLADAVWGETDDIFAVLRPRQILNLVAYGSAEAS